MHAEVSLRGERSEDRSSFRKPQRLLLLAALLSLACLNHTATGWGVNSRLALVFAIVDQGTFSIDAYHATGPTATNDKAYFGGHYYSDKIFGVSLLALPVYAAMRGVGRVFSWMPSFEVSNYFLRLVAVSLPGALSVVLLWRLLIRGGAPSRRALVAVAFVFWGSLWFGFSSVFSPYTPGIASSLAALWIALAPGEAVPPASRSALTGLLCGFALLCDMTFGLVVLAIASVFALRVTGVLGRVEPAVGRGPDAARSLAGLAWAAAGGVLPLLLFVAYSSWIFGKPSIPYEYEALEGFRTSMRQGFMGVTGPRLGPLWFLTLHPYRGIFFWSPILAPAVWGALLGLRAPGFRRVYAWLALWGCVSYLAFNSGYYMWWGGWCMGPRFLLPMFALLPLGLVEILREERAPGWWWAVIALGAVSVAASAPLSFVDPQTPMVNEYALVARARVGSSLVVPQFAQWKSFFAPASYRLADGQLAWLLVSRFVLAMALPLWLVGAALRRTPGKRPLPLG